MQPMRIYLTALMLVAALAPPIAGQGPNRAPLDRYELGLASNPDNAFYQYAAAQTARRLGLEAPTLVAARARAGRWQPQLYETTTGALAVQESLQLDRLAGTGDTVGPSNVPIETLQGIATPSIPFARLARGRTPVVEPLAKAIPSDWYYAHFPRVSAMRRVLAASDRWGGHLLAAYSLSGRDARLRDKLEKQLLLTARPELDGFYDLVVGDVAVTGSDPFVAEGSDVTVLFTVKNALLFNARLELERGNAVSASSGQRLSIMHEPYRSWTVDGVVSADRSLSTYSTVRGDIAIISSSLAALRRVADTIDGLAPSMASSDDFEYMRIVKPYSDQDEDGFLFLSDAFVRRVTSPRLKIGEARRVRCAVSLQSAAYSVLMFGAERGRIPGSIEDLLAAGVLDQASLRCPDGGRYTLDGHVPVCSIHNRLRYMTPNLELRLDRVAPEEVESYTAFREGYARYWRRYIDPVGIRVRAGERLEVDATVLPLVENSIYSEAVEGLGTTPVSLARPQLPSAVATFDVKLPTEEGADLGGDVSRMLGVDGKVLFGRALGDHASIQIADAEPVLALDMAGALGGPAGMGLDEWLLFSPLLSSLALPTAVVVPIRDRAVLDGLLAQVRGQLLVNGARPDPWFQVDNYQLVQGGTRTVEAVSVRFLVLQWRVFYAVVGDHLVVATDRALVDELAAAAPSGAEPGHLRLELAPSRWKRLAPTVALAYAEDARRACLGNPGWIDALRAAFPKPPHELDAEALALLGATFTCPDGGRYVAGPESGTACALHGTRAAPRQGPRPQPGSPAAYVLESVRRIEATLTLTPDGLESRIRIE
jgi:hypothetical protein